MLLVFSVDLNFSSQLEQPLLEIRSFSLPACKSFRKDDTGPARRRQLPPLVGAHCGNLGVSGGQVRICFRIEHAGARV